MRDVHWCVTVFYQQIENGNIANQIYGFTIDYGKFILIGISISICVSMSISISMDISISINISISISMSMGISISSNISISISIGIGIGISRSWLTYMNWVYAKNPFLGMLNKCMCISLLKVYRAELC